MPPNTQLEKEISKSIAKFAADFYSKVVEKTDDNVVVSPYSVASVLTALLLGAKGDTLKQIETALHLTGIEKTALYFCFSKTSVQPSPLLIANRLYVMQGFRIKKPFKDALSKLFDFDIENLNFAEKDASALTINKFVEQKTNNNIKDIIQRDSFDAETRLVVVNAIYFKADWLNKFPSIFTKEEDFYIGEVQKAGIDYMKQMDYFNFAFLEDLDASVLEMKYRHSSHSFFIVLPKNRTGLSALEASLKNYDFERIADKLEKELVHVMIPKFKIEFELELNNVLKELGVKDAFEREKADLNDMLEPIEPIPLHVTQIIHKAFIRIDESGTEAAAFTFARLRGGGPPRTPPLYKTFVADHPFLYYIMDMKENAVIFNGCFKKPETKSLK